jgi:hypothetical protein
MEEIALAQPAKEGSVTPLRVVKEYSADEVSRAGNLTPGLKARSFVLVNRNLSVLGQGRAQREWVSVVQINGKWKVEASLEKSDPKSGIWIEYLRNMDSLSKALEDSEKTPRPASADVHSENSNITSNYVFTPGKGVQNGPTIGGPESDFISLVGADQLESAEMKTGWAGMIIVYREKSDKWRAIVRKNDKSIVQLFHCGDDWELSNGFSPAEPFSKYRKHLGREIDRAVPGYYTSGGVGFRDEIEVKQKDGRGVDRLDTSYQCVTVYRVGDRDDHTGWVID